MACIFCAIVAGEAPAGVVHARSGRPDRDVLDAQAGGIRAALEAGGPVSR